MSGDEEKGRRGGTHLKFEFAGFSFVLGTKNLGLFFLGLGIVL